MSIVVNEDRPISIDCNVALSLCFFRENLQVFDREVSRAWTSGRSFFHERELSAARDFIEERELSAARDFHWRAQDVRRSNFELESIIWQQKSAYSFTS